MQWRWEYNAVIFQMRKEGAIVPDLGWLYWCFLNSTLGANWGVQVPRESSDKNLCSVTLKGTSWGGSTIYLGNLLFNDFLCTFFFTWISNWHETYWYLSLCEVNTHFNAIAVGLKTAHFGVYCWLFASIAKRNLKKMKACWQLQMQ